MFARVSGVTSQFYGELQITGLTCERLALELGSAETEQLDTGELVELQLADGPEHWVVLDGEVIPSDDSGRLVIRILNLDAERRGVVRALARQLELAAAEVDQIPVHSHEYRKTPGATSARRARKTTAVFEPEELEQLRRQGGNDRAPATTAASEPEGLERPSARGADAPPDARGADAPIEADPERAIQYTSLNEALRAAASADEQDGAEPTSGQGAADPTDGRGAATAPPRAISSRKGLLRLAVPADAIDWGRVDSRAASVLSAVNGARDVEAVVSASPLSRATTLHILEELLAQGLIGEQTE